MSISTLHGIDKIVIGGSLTLNAITSVRGTTEIESLMNRPAGHIAPMCRANLSEKPRIVVQTPDIAAVLAAIPVNGLATATDSYLYQKKKTETGSVARGTTAHTRWALSQVLVYWTRITLPHNGEGSIEVVIIPVWDGTNDVIVPTGSVALATNLSCTYRFGAGPVAINTDVISGIQNIEVTSGVQTEERGASSERWTTFAGILQVNPMVRITTTTIAMTSFGISGTALDGTDGLSFFARCFRTPDDDTSHILFTGLNGAIIVEEESAQGTDDYEAILRAELVSASDSVMPLIATTAQAIA